MFISFDTTHERDRQTDTQTDRHRMTAYAALMHSGNNECKDACKSARCLTDSGERIRRLTEILTTGSESYLSSRLRSAGQVQKRHSTGIALKARWHDVGGRCICSRRTMVALTGRRLIGHAPRVKGQRTLSLQPRAPTKAHQSTDVSWTIAATAAGAYAVTVARRFSSSGPGAVTSSLSTPSSAEHVSKKRPIVENRGRRNTAAMW